MVLTWAALAAFLIWWLQPAHIPSNFRGRNHNIDVVLFVLLTATFAHRLFMDGLTWSWPAGSGREEVPPSPADGLRVAFITTFVPASEPLNMLRKTLVGDAGGRVSA